MWADGCVCACVLTDRLVFDGGAGHTEVQLAVLFDAGIDQSLHWALILEQQEGVACAKYSGVIHAAGDAKHWQRVMLEFSAVITVAVCLITTFCIHSRRTNSPDTVTNASHNSLKTKPDCTDAHMKLPLQNSKQVRENTKQNKDVMMIWHTFGGEIGFALRFVRPVHKQVSETPETGCYLIWN